MIKIYQNDDVTSRICRFCNWSYDLVRQEVMTRDKHTNLLKIFPWPSLDAIYDAESKLSPQQLKEYTDILCDITYNEEYPDHNIEHLIHLPIETKLRALTQIINLNTKTK